MLQPGMPWLADGYQYKLFANEKHEKKPILPSESDSFNLLDDDDTKSFAGIRVSTPCSLSKEKRVKSASCIRLQDRNTRTGSSVSRYGKENAPPSKQRPISARPPPGPSPPPPQRRVRSANTVRTRALERLRQSFTLVNKLYEDEYLRANINLHPVSPAPDYRYFDRHSRCMDHTHMHMELLYDRPRTACEIYREPCPSYSRPVSAATSVSGRVRRSRATVNADTSHQPGRYINYHRPRTAPGTRREIQHLQRHSYILQGYAPHFCNIVRQVQLHNRGNGRDTPGFLDDESEYGELIAESVDGSLIGQWRKQSDASSIPEREETMTMSGSGTEGRPASPSSTEGDGHGRIPEEQEPIRTPTTPIVQPVEPPKVHITTHTPPEIPKPAWETEKPKSPIPPLKIPSGQLNEEHRSPSPKRPPPTPEALSPGPTSPRETVKPPTPPATSKRQRHCVSKKTKKPVERKKKEKVMEEVKPPELPKEEEPPAVPGEQDSTDQKDVKVDLQVPDLPAYKTEEKKSSRSSQKPERQFMVLQTNDPFKVDHIESLDDQLKANRKPYEYPPLEMNGEEAPVKKPAKMQSWIAGRLALSQQSSRFELPMDMKMLETMCPQDYIRKYCIISHRRQTLYQKIFLKNKDKSGVILVKDIEKTLKDVLVNTITSQQIKDLCDMLEVNNETKIDYKLFSGMAALAERVLYPRYVTEDTADMPEYQKEKIECADFCALDWKFHGINVNPPIYKLLKQLG